MFRTNLGTTNGAHIANSASPTGSNTLYLWTSGTARTAYAALPPMSTLQSGTYKLGFEAFASVTANGILQIGYLDPSNNFLELTTFSVPTTATLYPFSYNLPALPAGVTQLAIKNPGIPANSLSIDNLSYQPQALSTAEVATERLSVYPNPFAEVLSVSDISDVKSVTVTDASGRLIQIINKVSRELNLSNLSSGMYFVSLMMDDGSVQTFKVIKR